MRVFYKKSITVYRLVSASSKESYAESGQIKGMILPLSAQEAFITEGNPAQQYKLVADYGVDVKKTDKLVCNDTDYIVSGIQKFDFGGIRRVEATLELFNS